VLSGFVFCWVDVTLAARNGLFLLATSFPLRFFGSLGLLMTHFKIRLRFDHHLDEFLADFNFYETYS